MALSGSRLQGVLYADILADLQAQFPVNSALLPAEQAKFNTAQSKFALAMSQAIGPDVVTEIVTNAEVLPGSFTNGAGAVSGEGTVR